jgi:hypothetical protein
MANANLDIDPVRPVGTTPDSDGDKPPGWLVIITGVVGALAVLAGLLISIDKIVIDIQNSRQALAQSEERRSSDERARASAESETESAREKEREIDLQIERMKLHQETENLDRRDRAAQRSETAAEDRRIADLVSAAISGNEPQLAQLLLYSNRNPDHRDLVLAGLEAKSEFLKTPTEVRLLFVLFNRIGSDALPIVIKTNRKFVAGYDELLWRQFSAELLNSRFLNSSGGNSFETADEVDEQLGAFVVDFANRMPSTGLAHHAGALIISTLNKIQDSESEDGDSFDSKKGITRAVVKASRPVEDLNLALVRTEFLFQSVEFLNRMLPITQRKNTKLDLRDCFLMGLHWEDVDAIHTTLDVTGAMIDGADFEPDHLSHDIVWNRASTNTLKSASIDVICQPLFSQSNKFSEIEYGLETTPFLSGARFGPLSSWKGPEEFQSDLADCAY